MRIRGLGRRLARKPRHCAVCGGYRVVSGDYVYDREPQCTCGQGGDVLAMHDIACDAVPCPFCQLLGTRALEHA